MIQHWLAVCESKGENGREKWIEGKSKREKERKKGKRRVHKWIVFQGEDEMKMSPVTKQILEQLLCLEWDHKVCLFIFPSAHCPNGLPAVAVAVAAAAALGQLSKRRGGSLVQVDTWTCVKFW